MIPRIGIEFGLRHMAGVIDPLAEPHPFYALIELTSPTPGPALREAIESVLARALEDGVVGDAVIAANESQRRELWRIRDVLSESQKYEGGSIKHDVSVPVSRFPDFVRRATERVEGILPGIRVVAFGHVGDGNVHFNLSQPVGADKAAFLARWHEFNRIVHDLAIAMGGSFSA